MTNHKDAWRRVLMRELEAGELEQVLFLIFVALLAVAIAQGWPR